MKNIMIKILLLILLLSSCHSNDTKPEVTAVEIELENNTVELNQDQISSLEINSEKATIRTVNPLIEMKGFINIDPQNSFDLHHPFGGQIQNLLVLKGQPVKKGQILFTLENPQFVEWQQSYLENLTQLKYAEIEYKRQAELAKEQINSSKNVQKAKLEFQLIQTKLASIKTKLIWIGIDLDNLEHGNFVNSIAVKSPTQGIISEILSKNGSYVDPTDLILQIINTEAFYAELSAYEKDLSKIKLGQEIQLEILGETYTKQGKIYLIEPKIQDDKTVKVHAKIFSDPNKLFQNQFANAKIYLGKTEALTVLESAIISYKKKNFVFIVSGNGKYESREVQTGIQADGFIEIISGIESNDNVVISGAFQLLAILKNKENE